MRVLTSLAAVTRRLSQITCAEQLGAELEMLSLLSGFDGQLLISSARHNGGDARLASSGFGWLAEPRFDAAARLLLRAAQAAPLSFGFGDLGHLVRLTSDDRREIGRCQAHGLAQACIVPIHAPRGACGVWALLTACAATVTPEQAFLVQALAPFVGAAARRLIAGSAGRPMLAPRQRECLLWAARGGTDREIARIMAIGEDTVDKQLRRVRERYGVARRITVIVRALFDGTLSFEEVLEDA